MAWEKKANKTLTGSADTITPDLSWDSVPCIMGMAEVLQTTGAIRIALQVNSETSGYNIRDSENFGADSTATSQSFLKMSGSNTYDGFVIFFGIGLASLERLFIAFYCGDASPVTSHEIAGKSTNNGGFTLAILTNDQAGDYAADSNMMIQGT